MSLKSSRANFLMFMLGSQSQVFRSTRLLVTLIPATIYQENIQLRLDPSMAQDIPALQSSYKRILTSVIVVILYFSTTVIACPELECAPIISKCQITDACRCDTSTNGTCQLACSHCLGELFADCCSCVGICPKEVDGEQSLESHVKSFESVNEELFELFASDEDTLGRWEIHRFPIATSNTTQANCTMAFIASCVNLYNCESSCISMGASGFRWFHNGCCECIGRNCINFGVNQSRCKNCPLEDVNYPSNEDL